MATVYVKQSEHAAMDIKTLRKSLSFNAHKTKVWTGQNELADTTFPELRHDSAPSELSQLLSDSKQY